MSININQKTFQELLVQGINVKDLHKMTIFLKLAPDIAPDIKTENPKKTVLSYIFKNLSIAEELM